MKKKKLPQIINKSEQGKNLSKNGINSYNNNNNNSNNNSKKNNNKGNGKNKKEESLLNVKTNVVKNFNQNNNLKSEISEYENPFYKNMINYFIEERARSEITNYSLLFPKKENIEKYSIFLTKEGTNDTNIVMWNYLLTKDDY